MLAHHALESDQFAKAVEFALSATGGAVAQSNYPLANPMLGIALKAAQALTPTPENQRVEARILAWQHLLLWPLARGITVGSSLDRSRQIAHNLNDDRLLAEASVHQAYVHSDTGPIARALTCCDVSTAAAERLGDERMIAESTMARSRTYCVHGKLRAGLAAIAPYGTYWDDRRDERKNFLVTARVLAHHLQASAKAGLGDARGAAMHTSNILRAAAETNRPMDRYVAHRTLGEVLGVGGRQAQASDAFLSAMAVAREADLEYLAVWSEAARAIYMIQGGDAAEGVATLRRILGAGGSQLNILPRLAAESALLCHRLNHEGGTDIPTAKDLLKRVRENDLPAVELRILDTLARCDPNGPPEWATAAKTIRAEEGYAPCAFSDAEVSALMEMFA